MSHDLLVDGVSLREFGVIASFDGVFREAPLRGSNLVFPGVKGATHTEKVRGAYAFTVPLTLSATTEAAMQDQLDALRALLDTSAAPVTLTRVRPTGAGVVSETCLADVLGGLEPNLTSAFFGRIAIVFENLDAGWTPVP